MNESLMGLEPFDVLWVLESWGWVINDIIFIFGWTKPIPFTKLIHLTQNLDQFYELNQPIQWKDLTGGKNILHTRHCCFSHELVENQYRRQYCHKKSLKFQSVPHTKILYGFRSNMKSLLWYFLEILELDCNRPHLLPLWKNWFGIIHQTGLESFHIQVLY